VIKATSVQKNHNWLVAIERLAARRRKNLFAADR
jgi:hypothetical protein